MSFELRTVTRVKVLDVRTLSSKDRAPDEPPGAQLLLQADLPVEVLAQFDGLLPGMLYRKAGNGAQGKLEGLEGVELTAIGEHVKRMPWAYEQTGCSVHVHRATTKQLLEECKVHRVNFAPQANGGIRVQWTVDAPSLSDSVRGKLTGLKSTEIELTQTAPEVDESQQQIPGTQGTDPNEKPREPDRGKPGDPYPFPRGKPGEAQGHVPDTQPDATSTFVEAHAGPAAAPPPPPAPSRAVGRTTVITKRTRRGASL
jgi:hypothetical protein